MIFGLGSWWLLGRFSGFPGRGRVRFDVFRVSFSGDGHGLSPSRADDGALVVWPALWSVEAGPGVFGGGPGAEEPVQAEGVGDQSHDDAAGPGDDHGGDADDGVEEVLELHADVGVAIVRAVHHHRVPGCDVPGERGDEHVGPVAVQVVHGGVQGVDAGLGLADDVFLVAAVVCEFDDLSSLDLSGQLCSGLTYTACCRFRYSL
jgi:hypothetical protein